MCCCHHHCHCHFPHCCCCCRHAIRPNKMAYRKFRTVSNATLARRHLSVWMFYSILFSMGVQLRKGNCAFKAASIPARRQSEHASPRLFGFIFRRCPPISIFFQVLVSALKRHLRKRHFDTHRGCLPAIGIVSFGKEWQSHKRPWFSREWGFCELSLLV